MSTDWYLMSNDGTTDGSLNSILETDGATMLDEIMASGIRDHVTIYNSDLSVGVEVDCIMQNKAADTYLQSHQRRIICHPNTIKAGQYVYDGINYWLAIGLVDNVYGVYEKCVLLICQYKVKWQTDDGTIVERWANATSASKYDTGQYVGEYYTTATNNYTLIMPSDDEVRRVYDKRVFLDMSDPAHTVFKITRDDDILYEYGDKGACCSFIVGRDEFNPATDNPELRLCDYNPVPPTPQKHGYYIEGSDSVIMGRNNIYDYAYYDNGVQQESECTWDVDTSDTSVTVTTDGTKLILRTNSYNDIGQSIIINLVYNSEVVATKEVDIASFL